jgi:hypothetical protein
VLSYFHPPEQIPTASPLHPTQHEQRCLVLLTYINVPGGTAECHDWALAWSLLILVFETGVALIQRVLERE